MATTVWREVISSIEETGSLYDEVNEAIPFGRASKARAYAVQRLLENGPRLVLDSGAGPGSMSVILLRHDPQMEVIALDYSSQLQRTCRERVKDYRSSPRFVQVPKCEQGRLPRLRLKLERVVREQCDIGQCTENCKPLE